jgi:cation:H+ antiporter
VIGLTVVAVGTSLPELATSVVAAIRKEQDIAIGNVIGSNIFNILAILGIAPLISPIKATGVSYVDMFLMLGLSILLYPFMKSGLKINRIEGAVLLAVYIGYTAYLIVR